jgi:hypothetical protein
MKATSLRDMDSHSRKSEVPTIDIDSLDQDEERHSPVRRPQYADLPASQHRPTGIAAAILRWSPRIFMLSYFTFSISIYTMLPEEATKVFWFLYLTIGTFLAGTTLLEAYDGLSLLKLARKAVAKAAKSGWKDDDKLPYVELIVEETATGGYERVRGLRDTIIYPEDKIRVTVLPNLGDDTALFNHLCYHQDQQAGPLPEITAVFRANQSPHPHAVRHAVDRLTTDKKIDVLQSRSVLTWPTGVSFFRAVYSSLASLQHDAIYGLILPGRTVTWGLPVSYGTALFGRTAALQNAMRAMGGTSPRQNGVALAFSALSQNTKAAYDMSVITFTECPSSIIGTSRLQTREAVQWAASTNFLSLAFTKAKTTATATEKAETAIPSRTFKQRFCIVYTLLLTRLASHAVLQYLSLSLALLFTKAPSSAAEFSTLIFFPYTISLWLIVSGLVCLAATVAMIHSASSEFAPPGWTFPVLVLVYPFLALGQAFVDVYAQVGVFMGSF